MPMNMTLGMGSRLELDVVAPYTTTDTNFLLQEDGFDILLEDGFRILLENA